MITDVGVPAAVPVICRRPAAVSPAGPRVLVFGSARSGTTLMLQLLRTFATMTVRDTEGCVADLLEDPHPGWLAIKRTAHCAQHLLADLPLLRPDVWIIDIVRDPRDVVTSVLEPFPGYYCSFGRWERDLRVSEAIAGTHLRYVRIRFEELLERPGDLQNDVADMLGLRLAGSFADFAHLVPDTLPTSTVRALGGVRALDTGRAGRWRDETHRARVADQLAEHPQMETALRWMGYPPTPEWPAVPHGGVEVGTP